MPFRRLIAVACTIAALVAPLHAQDPLFIPGTASEDSIRLAPLRDSLASTAGWLLRSPSSLDRPSAATWGLIPFDVTLQHNAGMPFSMNDGALWAGVGANARVIGGVRARWNRVRLILAPELVYSANADFALTDSTLVPPLPAGYDQFANPWFAARNSIDLPLRFGTGSQSRVVPGQSALVVDAGAIELGAATENQWWGPGVRNALLLSSNAAGFPHLFARTARPLRTPIGAFEARWLAGALAESEYFDDDSSNDTRSIALLGVTWQPWFDRGLTLGAARSVFGPAAGIGDAFADFAQVLSDVGQPNARANADSTRSPGRDQLLSLFARWVAPALGFEAYAEWARAEMPRSLRDFLVQPNHSQAYTVGLQWLSRQSIADGQLRVRAEASYLEQSATWRFRPVGTWYTSRAVAQGYTHEGQSLGAWIGPGSSSQWGAIDYLRDAWQLGVSLERVRWQEDAHSLMTWPSTGGWCEHDVTMRPAISGAMRTRWGQLSGDAILGTRMNPFFTYHGTCPQHGDSPVVDVSVRTLRVQFSPRW